MTDAAEPPAASVLPGPRRTGISRRRFLTGSALAGASLGAAACTHPAAVRQASARAVPAPRAVSAPRWTADIGGDFPVNGFASLGATIVAWGDTEARGFDVATGAAAWTLTAGAGSTALHSAWWGVFGQTLTGLSAAPAATLVGYDAAGRRTVSLPVGQAFGEAGIVTADRALGCVGVGNGVAVIVAVTKPAPARPVPPPFVATIAAGIDLADGTRRWSRELSWYEYALLAVQQHLPVLGGTVSGDYCYLQDGDAISAIELSTGAVRWSAKLDEPPAGVDLTPSMSVAGGALVLSNSWEYAALDTGSGARLWSMAHRNTANLAADGNRVYVLAPDATVEAFDSRTRAEAWRAPSPPSLSSVGGMQFLTSASATLLAGALGDGILVLSAAGGQPQWAYQRPEAVGSSTWNALIAGSAVYGLELYGYGQYRRRSLYAFPSAVT